MVCFDELSNVSFDELLDVKKCMIEAMSLAQRIEVDLEANGDYDNLKLLESITRCCFRVLGNIKNSEEMARLERYQASRINLADYLEDLLIACRMRIMKANIKLSYECEDDIFVRVDADRLTACLMNLIINAIQNNDAYESCSEIKIKVTKLMDSVSIAVSDNGYGMESEELSRILNSEDHKGGLAVVKKFCEKAGTQIITETDVDCGLMISFRLPLSTEGDMDFYRKRTLVQFGTYSTVNVLMTKVRDTDIIS